MDLGIAGRIAVVTGGDSGMGFATAELLLREGARVVLSDRDQDQLEDAVARLASVGEVLPVVADLTDAGQVEGLRTAALRQFGRVDILVNAGRITGATGDFDTLSDADWMASLDTDLMAAVRACRAFLPGMAQLGWGRVVLVGSEDALQPYADELPYRAAKAGVLNLAKGLSKAYGRRGVLVNAVSPAFIATPMTDAMMQTRAARAGTSFEEAVRSFLGEERPTLQLARRGGAEEVASVIAFLCSERASFVNGANIRVDGGSVAAMG